MIAFDTEDDSKGNIYLINFFDGKKHYTYKTKHHAVNFILKSQEQKFYAHNLEYDLINIFYPHNLHLLEMYYNGGRLLFAKIRNTRKKFFDTFNFCFMSLEKIGEEIGLEKLNSNGDFNNISYCRRDTEIVYNFQNSLHNTVKSEFDLTEKSTIAGTSQNIFLKKFDLHDCGGCNVDPVLLNAYYGGRVECFSIGEINNHIYEMDVNSMYPYVMQKFKYPVSDGYETIKPEEKLYISQVDISIDNKTVFPVIPYREKLLLFPTGNFTTWLTSVELEKAIEHNQVKKIKFIKTINFPYTEKIFENFIEYFYKKRKIAKDVGNDFLSSFYKRIMNATYGRFAIQNGMEILSVHRPNKNVMFIEKLQNDMRRWKLNIENDSQKNFAIPLFITAYSRIVLFETIINVLNNDFIPLYCDTDSIYFTTNGKKDLQKTIEKIYKIFPINNNLGAYSLNCYCSGAFLNAKQYFCVPYSNVTKYTCKGIPKNNRDEYFSEKKTSYKRPMKLRSALRGVQGINANVWYDFFISQSGTYKKRRIVANASILNTLPIELEN